MKNKIYILPDINAERLYYHDNLDGFRELVEGDSLYLCVTVEEFNTIAEKNAYLKGLSFGMDEITTAEMLILCSDNDCDKPYIELIEANL